MAQQPGLGCVILPCMDGYIVSFQDGLLRVSLTGNPQVAEKKTKVSIKNHEEFAEELAQLILEEFGPKVPKAPLNFLLSPLDIHLNFLTVNKSVSAENLTKLAEEKLLSQDLDIEKLYFSYQKIAPFVYQLIAVDKEILENYVNIAGDMDLPLASVVPWILLLPKYVSRSGEPAIFVLDTGEHKHLALSELGGIYYLGSLNDTKLSGELEELIQKLSVYQRNTPITDIYTFDVSDLKLGKKYNVKALDVENPHTLFESESTANLALLSSQINLLNLLSPEEIEKREMPWKYVGLALATILFGLGVWWLFNVNKNNLDQINQNENPETTVTETPETTESTQSVTPQQPTNPNATLNKAYLKIRVENGTSIAGLAGRTRDSLVKAGYEVVSIGDSTEPDRTTTLVKFTTANAIYKDLLLGDLNPLFKSITVEQTLAGNLGYDVLIIAGSDGK